MTFRTEVRAASVALLAGYATANAGSLKQMYPGRPLSIFPPCAFIDAIDEPEINWYDFGGLRQRVPLVRIRFVQGMFDSEDTVDGQDALVDGFIQYVSENRDAAGNATQVTVTGYDDEPGWVPEWLPVRDQRPYYSTLVTLSGLKLESGLV